MDNKAYKSTLKTTDKYVNILKANGYESPEKLLWYFPRTYEDRRQIKPLSQLKYDGSQEITKAKVIKKWMIRTPTGKQLIEIQLIDEEENKCSVQALNNRFLLRSTKNNTWYYIIGKPKQQWSKISFWFAEMIEAIDTSDMKGQVGCIYPVYSDLQWIKSAWFSKKIPPMVDSLLETVQDLFPMKFYERYDLMKPQEMIKTLHLPEDIDDTVYAKKTIFFKRMLRVQLHSLISKRDYQADATFQKEPIDRELIKEFLATLPFELTWAQKRALKELIENLHEEKAMLRLMQWDVWSGKTIVAATAARYTIKKFKGQVAFLAPIEVLAKQHHKSLAKLFLPLGVRVELLTWATKASEKTRIKQALHTWAIDLIVWTHAIIQKDVFFNNLFFAVIDEQHKFGVRQRAYLQRHGSPHLLQMTATPIPRSMALAFFWEFSVSTIDEMPAWRKPITTKIIGEAEFNKMKPWVMTKISQWQKVFLITPLIEESESEALENVKSATAHFEELRSLYKEIAPQIGLLHWRMKSSEKDEIMKKFKDGTYTMLVSTTVIEVGIDIPEATVMIIYNAERFGLSQLHQLRGRVWRSDLQSYCFLETKKKSWETYQRLKHMETVNDWFELSEIDLKYRGPGEFLGVRQSWETDIPLEILMDTKMLETVQDAAKWMIGNHEGIVDEIVKQSSGENILV